MDPAILSKEETEGPSVYSVREWLRLLTGKAGFPVPALGMLLGLKM